MYGGESEGCAIVAPPSKSARNIVLFEKGRRGRKEGRRKRKGKKVAIPRIEERWNEETNDSADVSE